MSSQWLQKLQKNLHKLKTHHQKYAIGYPANLGYDYTPLQTLIDLYSVRLNNVGPPGVITPWKMHTKESETKVVEFFCGLWKFKPEETYGYLTSSGTEGNLQALYIARKLHPDATLYFSEDSHYSIKKIADILKLPFQVIQSTPNGEIDYEHLEKEIADTKGSVIVCANLGTTFKGAIDDTREIYRIIRKHQKEDKYYLHADAALMGFVLPFFEKDTFFRRYIHSISVSGHKFLGVPFPSGIFVMDTKVLPKEADFIDYINCTDSTIAGSRSGHSALFMEYMIQLKGANGFEKDAAECIRNADYLVEALLDLKVNAWRNHNSFTVVLDKLPAEICEKWQLACQGDQCHIIVLCHVTRSLIDELVVDIKTCK